MIKYDENSSYIKELNICKTDVFKSVLMGYGLGLLIVISPILILYNCFIYTQITKLLVFAVVMFVWLFFTISDIFYHKALCLYDERVKERTLKCNYLLNSVLYFVMCMIGYLVVLLIL